MHCFMDDRGRSVLSLFDHIEALPGQFNASTMFPQAVKAWHRHAQQDDHWVVLAGDLKIGLFNSEARPLTARLRLAGRAAGEDLITEITVAPETGTAVYLGEHRPGALQIPAGLWHGGVAVGPGSALLLYYVTRKYDPRQPDEERRAWDCFPFSWDVAHK